VRVATVLLVEDEDTLRDSVARYLEFEGHQVLAAANGREAFDLGVSGRPDVLVADWMLRNHIHGLHVAQTLRMVDPELGTILITGFPSRDLERELENGVVARMLEKPFDLEELHRAVVTAAQQRQRSEDGEAAVLEIADDGRLAFANGGARRLLADVPADAAEVDASTLFGAAFRALFDRASLEWERVRAPGAACDWLLRARPRDAGGWLIALCREDEPHWVRDPRLRILLDHHSRSSSASTEFGPVIVLERDGAVRRLLATQIDRIGALCYVADDIDGALRLLSEEPRAHTVMIDVETAGSELRAWALAIATARPSARIIGTGASGKAGDLRALGLDRLLDKPWRIDELVEVLRA